MDVARDRNVSASLFDVVAPPRPTSSDKSGPASFQNIFVPPSTQSAAPAKSRDESRPVESSQPRGRDEAANASNKPAQDKPPQPSDASSSSETPATPTDDQPVDEARLDAESPQEPKTSESKQDEKHENDAAVQVAAVAAVVENQKPVLPVSGDADQPDVDTDEQQPVGEVKEGVAAKLSPDSAKLKEKRVAATQSSSGEEQVSDKAVTTTTALVNAEEQIEAASLLPTAEVAPDVAPGKSLKSKAEKARSVAEATNAQKEAAVAGHENKINKPVAAEAFAPEEKEDKPIDDAATAAPDASTAGKREIGDLQPTSVAETKTDPAAKPSTTDATTSSVAQPVADTAAPVVGPTLSLPADKPVESKSSSDESRPIGSDIRTPSSLVRDASAKQKTVRGGEVDPAKFMQRVARAFQSAHERQTEVKIRLSPPELGSLSVEVKVTEGMLSARMQVETPEAKSAVLDNLPMLRERLQEQGIRIDKFDVDIMDHSDHQPQQPEERTPRDEVARRVMRAETRVAKAHVETGEPVASSSRALDTKQINVVI